MAYGSTVATLPVIGTRTEFSAPGRPGFGGQWCRPQGLA